MELGLRDKVALVTGGTSGIGLAIARQFVDEGAAVAICGRDRGRLDAAVQAMRQAGGRAEGFTAHLDRVGDVRQLVADTVSSFGRLDIVVSNAGTHLKGNLEEVPVEDLEQHLRTKVLGPWELARQALPHLRKQSAPRFIVIIGQAGKVPGADIIASAITNAAQHAFVKSLSDYLGRDHILVNAVCPSRIKSPLTDTLNLEGERYLGRSLEHQQSGWGLQVPLGRFGEADDIASAVLFLASERASFLTGTNIDVDGGYQRMIF
jgi:NAD(P)-dependent dehydrogenase (short-subunit alcohol dehydrogenase family)